MPRARYDPIFPANNRAAALPRLTDRAASGIGCRSVFTRLEEMYQCTCTDHKPLHNRHVPKSLGTVTPRHETSFHVTLLSPGLSEMALRMWKNLWTNRDSCLYEMCKFRLLSYRYSSLYATNLQCFQEISTDSTGLKRDYPLSDRQGRKQILADKHWHRTGLPCDRPFHVSVLIMLVYLFIIPLIRRKLRFVLLVVKRNQRQRQHGHQ